MHGDGDLAQPADPRRAGGLRVWAGVAAAWLGLAGGVGWLATRSPIADGPPAAEITWVDAPPIVQPPAVAAAAAALPDDTPVLGVAAGGKFRAYSVAALSTPRTHVVNDRLGGEPVAVTYCDRTACSRAFAGPAGLRVAGWAGPTGRHAGTLLVRDGPGVFRQDSGLGHGDTLGALPYPEVPVVRTTWGAWRAAHPDTDLSVGG